VASAAPPHWRSPAKPPTSWSPTSTHHGNQDTAGMIENLGGQALPVSCDVTRSEDVQAALTKTVERFGRMDYAFNNAGAEQQPKASSVSRLDPSGADQIDAEHPSRNRKVAGLNSTLRSKQQKARPPGARWVLRARCASMPAAIALHGRSGHSQ